jgi:peptidylprolyl isomerase
VSARTSTIALIAAAALGAGACGNDQPGKSASPPPPPPPPAETTASTPDVTETTTATTTETTTTKKATASYDISKDRSTKPTIPKPTGDPPTALVVQDIVKGKGRGARAGDTVTVDYVGVSYSTGQQFDASWDSGQPFSFPLGAGRVIPGWDQGVVDMKKGGRRLLVIPPELAYGTAGNQGIAPNETLVFVIDLRKLG